MEKRLHLIERGDLQLFYFIDDNKVIKPNSPKVFNTIKDLFTNENKSFIDEEIEIIKELKSILNAKEENSLRTFDHFDKDKTQTNKITLMLTQDCNLACKYCYGGDSGKFNSKGDFMTKEMAKKSIDYHIKKSSSVKNFHILFFGGEPLMNLDTLKYAIEYCERLSAEHDIAFGYSMTTNGTLLTDNTVDYLKEKEIGLTISMDGPKEIHDKYRVFRNQKGSYETIVSNIKKLVEKDIFFSIRATLPPEYFEQYDQIYSHLESLGTKSVHISRLSVYEGINKKKLPIDEEINNCSISADFFDKTRNSEIMNIKHKNVITLKYIENVISSSPKRIFCGLFKGCTTISCNGDLYPCHRFVGLNGFSFGNIENGIDKGILSNLLDDLDKATENCNTCFARNICQRNCVREISLENGSFTSFSDEFCNNIKKDIEDAIIIVSIPKNHTNYNIK